ncbi:ABC transporter ATP-binding protein [Pontibacillus yanchengensis]|uniref:Cobalt ABC transporter ATP-binding protein n=1 Tax=Pontibacillus yanchengensis Y32 TaxID=1385514 RepID=A0A0A2TWZ8_9BACI|nr:ABC transporter ATP-binding protein [Pontibacillus yanchengensis]KGP73775.1 cobalt ABC transporter ATP-binding protein [Pontibacillus yanchengensis Y32]
MSEAIISIDQVSFKYPGGDDWVLQDSSLSVNKGEFLAIIGGNGSGKSTLCKTINGLIPHYYTGDFNGSVHVDGIDMYSSAVAVLSQKVGYVYQDFENQLMRPTVLEDVAFAPLNFGDPDFQQHAEWALEILGLTHLKDKSIWQLSGGQKHLTAIAGVLALNPDILIIDEPVAQLDPHHAKEIYQKLKVLQQHHGKTIIVIEHHTEFIADFCTDVTLIDQGKVLWKHDVKTGLQKVDDLLERQIFPPQVTQAALKIDHSNKSELPITLKEAVTYYEGLSITNPTSVEHKSDQHERLHEIVHLENVSHYAKSLRNETVTILNDIHLSIKEKERIALVGTNGAGKSTLMKCLAGIIKPSKGKGRISEYNLKNSSLEKLSQDVAYVFQNPEEMFIEDSIYKDLSFFAHSRNMEMEPFFQQLITAFRMENFIHNDGRLLSGGQQRRSSLAIGLAIQPSLLMLDEPTASLDVKSRQEMIRTLNQIDEQVKSVLIATHDMQLVAEWATRVIVMDQGKILFDGTPHELFAQEFICQQAGLIPPQMVQLSNQLNIHPVALSISEFVERIERIDSYGVS